ncbi:unnamed protein product [Triticum turgidum subsp. durum]|uniref:Hyaluronan/mRNA-binding protein domain-containing protein n=1 Tax=Triticum turgidum subsp. durum TaxID=4567 RepID=A0A9R0R6C5_TRITD|nr:unnamed protein product [Triticum turgidum subsp. durum]
MTSNQFDLLGDVDNDDPSQLLAAAAAKKAAEPKPAAPAAKPGSKPPAKTPPPAEDRGNRDGAGRGRGGRGGGGGARTGPRRDYGDADANGGFEGGGGGGGYPAPRLEDGEGKQAERGRGPRQPYRGGGGRRGGYSDGQNTDEFGRPHRSYERRSGTGRGFGMKRDGAGRGNWGTATDEGFPQENVEAVNTEEMTLEEYEKVLEEKRKAILALKAEERKVEVDKELQSMQQLSVKKDAEEVFIKLGSDKEKKKESTEREERAKKSLSINEFLKPAEGERYNGGRGRGRGFRGRGEARGGYNGGGGGGRRPAAAPAIEDQSQFPTLGGK